MEGCPERANNPGRLHEHFLYRHWKMKVEIVQEGPKPLPRCDQYGMHINAARIFKHRKADKCNCEMER